MNGTLLLAAWLTPLALAPFAFHRVGHRLSAAAPLPALAVAWLVPVDAILDLPWLLLGTQLLLDQTGRSFLLFSALLWLAATLMAAALPETHDHRRGFSLWFLLAMAGNFLLILAGDALTFYLGFALMGLSAYGLVAQRHSQRARRAGRVYLVWTLLGELALFAALVLLASQSESLRFSGLTGPLPAPAVPLLLLGFGVKLALPGLHWWLPGAYALAPAAAAAVLSGPMISTGLLGWLRFLPPGVPGLEGWGTGLLWVGVAGVALGVLAGVAQPCPRRVLGYSSVAKMGVITAGFGMALGQPEHGSGIVTALSLFALHHLLVKGSLFLGVGLWERAGARPWLLGGMALLALALAGAPLTGGAAAKALLSASLAQVGVDLAGLLLAAAVGTVLLMARMLWLLWRKAPAGDAPPAPALAGWALLLPALWLPFRPHQLPLDADGWLPLLLGIAIFLAAGFYLRRRPLQVSLRLRLRARRALRNLHRPLCHRRPGPVVALPGVSWPKSETLPSLPVAGLSWLGLLALLVLTLMLSP